MNTSAAKKSRDTSASARDDRPKVVVVGLGPGPAGLVTSETLSALERVTTRFVRTTRHPSASLVPDAIVFDDEYERHDTFAQVYA
ncbi:MAG: hypothetical protein ACKO8P_08400, partial [Actinomycetota bacterium]